ncbi:Gfo/Idh/MocA family protein [Polaribacter sp. Q13]|uniref:Gfo/Idh/MocA family protein n=1 Tax=Polaribacter sp. Q13 TaxID=2806551 RepID=UPI00193BAD57|nr:Gfo/Idh/MocA family oxidoreductase [Polaribacter sp. Q13]QVY66110.1 Gfo/Idh/MocA family oxidoreductase [Polaribacter sp. Q13]
MNRRNFLIKGTAASAALVTGTSMLANVGCTLIKDRKINIGVIGTGSRGSGLIPFLNEIEGVNVYACCDVLPSHLKKGIARTEGKAKGFTDYKDLLNDTAVDAVIISTPFSTHSQIAMDAVDAKKHVYCEKTLAKSYQGIYDLVGKVKKSKTIFQTGHQYHSSRLYTHIVKLIQEGKIGKINSFDCQWYRKGDWRRTVPKPSLEKAINWRMYREYSGGLVAELCSHQIDFVNWVLDSQPKQVMGFGGIDYWKDGRETFDNVHLMFNYANGAKAKFSSITTPNTNSGGYQIKVLGDKGSIVIGTDKAWLLSDKKTKKVEKEDVDGVSGATPQAGYSYKGEPIEVGHKNPSKQALLDFRDSILNNTQPKSDLYTGAKTAVCVQMALDAMYDNKIVNWDNKNTFS